jgi:hypothetical protein
LKGRDECQLDALALLVASLRSDAAAPAAQPLVGIGLDPDGFDERRAGPLMAVGGRPKSTGRTRFGRRSIALRHVLVAIR